MALPHYGGKSTKNYGSYHNKPKNYSRKISKDGFICSCLCPIVKFDDTPSHSYNIAEKVMIKYEIEPDKNRKTDNLDWDNRATWRSYEYCGSFKKIIELPEIFSKLLPTDYEVKVGHFTRDNIQVPFVYEIEILSIDKYNFLKNKQDRRNKLNKIKFV